MSSIETSESRRSASRPPSREVSPARGGEAERRPGGQSAISRFPQRGIIYRDGGSSLQEPNNDVLNYACACEIFREEISYRAQVRKFMWEYFD